MTACEIVARVESATLRLSASVHVGLCAKGLTRSLKFCDRVRLLMPVHKIIRISHRHVRFGGSQRKLASRYDTFLTMLTTHLIRYIIEPSVLMAAVHLDYSSLSF
jgi:hypothetical protein